MRLVAFLVLAASSCLAQGVIVNGGFGGPIGTSQTNNPVTMVFEHKQVQTLADGTHITNITHETFYRDSLGRTRTDHESTMFGFNTGESMRSVVVQDPVAQTMTNWQQGGGLGMQHQFWRNPWGVPVQRQEPLMRDASALPAPVPQLQRQVSTRPRPKTTHEDLGSQDVQGATCTATKQTTVYPVDFMGNDRPITSTTERCLSREFGRVLRETTEDPRTGARTTTLQSITRGEPDPLLFQPPPDYTERQQQAR